jgi:flagellar biosynthetic protein FliR
MGLLGRLVPQIHLFVVGFPITIGMGLLLVALSLSMYLNLLDDMFVQMFRNVNTVMRAMG